MKAIYIWDNFFFSLVSVAYIFTSRHSRMITGQTTLENQLIALSRLLQALNENWIINEPNVTRRVSVE